MSGKNNDTYWKTFLGIPRYKINWYGKYLLYKALGIRLPKLKDQREYWNTRGREYLEDFVGSGHLQYELFFQDMLVDELRQLKFDSFVEIGCGFGWNVKRVKQEFPHVRIGGVDFSVPQLENSRRYLPEIEMQTYLGDACDIPLADGSFDVGFTLGVYMNIHPDKIGRAIDEMIRISRKYVVHIEWDESHTTPRLRDKRTFKTNIVSHDYATLYKARGKKVMKFLTYHDFEADFYQRFPSLGKIGTWEQFEGPEKYILIVIEI